MDALNENDEYENIIDVEENDYFDPVIVDDDNDDGDIGGDDLHRSDYFRANYSLNQDSMNINRIQNKDHEQLESYRRNRNQKPNHFEHLRKRQRQSSIALQMVRIRSGFEIEFVCQTNGSKPNARIFWYLKDYHTDTLRNITNLRFVEQFERV